MVRILDLENYARENHIPIMEKEGIEFLLNLIKENNCKNILEIGCAIGYSAIRIASLDSNIKVTTLERDLVRYQEATKNIREFGLDSQVHVIYIDALNYVPTDMFDLIFIDAAKSQYIKFFERFSPQLSSNGLIVSDNISFHGYTFSKQPIESRNIRGLARKLRDYVTFLKENSEFKTIFYDVGDGISVTKRSST